MMLPASSLTRNAMAFAISDGMPMWPIGTASTLFARTAGGRLSVAAVLIGPGETALTVTPKGASSSARLRVKPITPAFADAYSTIFGVGTSAILEAMFKILPYLRSRMPFTTCREQIMVLSSVTSTTRRHISEAESTNSLFLPPPPPPTPFTRTSIRPNRRRISTNAVATSSFVQSSWMPRPSHPVALILSSICLTFGLVSMATTAFAPSRAKRSAVAPPMPPAAAVTTAILSFRRPGQALSD